MDGMYGRRRRRQEASDKTLENSFRRNRFRLSLVLVHETSCCRQVSIGKGAELVPSSPRFDTDLSTDPYELQVSGPAMTTPAPNQKRH